MTEGAGSIVHRMRLRCRRWAAAVLQDGAWLARQMARYASDSARDAVRAFLDQARPEAGDEPEEDWTALTPREMLRNLWTLSVELVREVGQSIRGIPGALWVAFGTAQGRHRTLLDLLDFACVLIAVFALTIIVQIPLHSYGRLRASQELGARWETVAGAMGDVRYRVTSVTPNGPARRGGLLPGDVMAVPPETLFDEMLECLDGHTQFPVRREGHSIVLDIETSNIASLQMSRFVYSYYESIERCFGKPRVARHSLHSAIDAARMGLYTGI